MKATLQSFAAGNLRGALRASDWAIISAELVQPYLPALAARINAARTSHLARALEQRGLEHYPTVGRYSGVLERGFLVLGVGRLDARELGRLYGQETVLVPAGLVWVDSGVTLPAVGVVEGLHLAAGDHTHLPATGATFAVTLAPAKRDRIEAVV